MVILLHHIVLFTCLFLPSMSFSPSTKKWFLPKSTHLNPSLCSKTSLFQKNGVLDVLTVSLSAQLRPPTHRWRGHGFQELRPPNGAWTSSGTEDTEAMGFLKGFCVLFLGLESCFFQAFLGWLFVPVWEGFKLALCWSISLFLTSKKSPRSKTYITISRSHLQWIYTETIRPIHVCFDGNHNRHRSITAHDRSL